jgi:hypothetical protein
MSVKKTVSLFLLYALVMMSVTGIVMYIMPPGRVAYWSGWTLFGLNKDQWGALHTVAGFIMLIAGSFHLYFNWKPMKSYFKEKAKSLFSKELLMVTLIGFAVTVMTAMQLPPFQSVMDLGEEIKESWESGMEEAPMPHTERLRLGEIATMLDIPYSALEEKLKTKTAVPFGQNTTLSQIASQANTSPAALYLYLSGETGSTLPHEGSGIGRKSVETVCRELDIPFPDVQKSFRSQGMEIRADEKLKEAAARLGMTPMELYMRIKAVKSSP